MNIYESGEDYLETILILSKQNGNVKSIDIAQKMNFSKPSVSVAMKKLKEKGLIVVDEFGFITLTSSGLEIANKTYDRHSFITDLLVSLGVNEDTAKEDACKIEHNLSDETFTAIKRYFNGFQNK